MILDSKAEFRSVISSNTGKLIVYFFDKQDQRHNYLADVIKELDEDFGDISFKVVEYELVKDEVMIGITPAIVAYDNKRIVNIFEECSTSMLVTFVRGWANQKSQETTVERIERLIKENPVILFMKGNKQKPFCKFSRAVIDMFNDCGLRFEAYNIFEDPELREELKKYSNWPTYPQLYINGNLIGGHDIIKELYESNTLKDEFPKEFIVSN